MNLETSQNENYQLVCNKGDMLLEVIKKTKEYKLTYSMVDIKKLNINEFLSFKIYDLIKKLNTDLIDNIEILKTIGESEIVLFFKFKNLAKELGMKQRVMFLNVKKESCLIESNILNVKYFAKSISVEDLPCDLNIDFKKYSILNCNYANTNIIINDTKIDMEYKFKITMKEDLPNYMENVVGLMMKKIFYNVKQFVDNIVK